MPLSTCVADQRASIQVFDFESEIVVCTPYSGIAEYRGTCAALECEGVIPIGMQWPVGFNEVHWDDGKFSYWIRRQRPEGAKGARKQFETVDWWMLRCNPLSAESEADRLVKEKQKELSDAIYRASEKGRAEWRLSFSMYLEAQEDTKFQQFKSACGIQEHKRCKQTRINGAAA